MLLDDLTSRDQRMVLVLVTLVHLADSYAQLNSDTEAITATAQMCIRDRYSGSSQTVNTREIFTSPNNYDVWLCGGRYSKMWRFQDVNYAVASEAEQSEILTVSYTHLVPGEKLLVYILL